MQKLHKKIIINAGIYENRVAILDNGVLDEFYVEQEGTAQLVGNIYKGKVESVLPNISAAFINIGTGKNGFLYVSDVLEKSPEVLDEAEDIIVEVEKQKKTAEITDLLKVGQEVIVQVVKEPIGDKGPRLTTHIAISGRFLVLTPFDNSIGISKRISETDERNRIRSIIKDLKLPNGIGCIIRTAGRGASEHNFKREARYLLNLWDRIRYRARKIQAPAMLYEEYDLILRTVRDQFTDDVERLVIDSKEKYKSISRFLNFFMPALKSRLLFYKGDTHLFEKYDIEKEIEKIFDRKVFLKSGGSIVIEQTEGMVAIDVNTAKFKGKGSADETVFKTNLEAAQEIARQIRLRDIGGIIIIDFIDMKAREHKIRVQEVLENSLRKDKARTNILSISPIGVIEMTRQRTRRSLESTTYRKCPYCDGRGMVKSNTTIAMQVLRRIERTCHDLKKREIMARVHPDIYNFMMENERGLIFSLQRKCGKRIKLVSDGNLHLESVEIE